MNRDPHLSELGEFLRARRAEVGPGEVGLRSDQRRRVPGLRREEVAVLACITPEYYARIEQGRLQASVPLLRDIAAALHMNEDQRTYLLALAAKEQPSTLRPAKRQQADAQLRRMMDDLNATPAFVIGRYTDILAWNALAAELWTDFNRYPADERVFVRLLITEPWMRERYADWEEVTRLAIAQLRMESARYPGDRHLTTLVEELSARDAQFREWWGAYDVAMRGKGTKILRHPAVGELTLDWDTLTSAVDPEQHMIVWTAPTGSRSHDGLRFLASLAADRDRAVSKAAAADAAGRSR